jgi:hypothetical protein
MSHRSDHPAVRERHLTAEMMYLLIDGLMEPAARLAAEAHLAQCARCRAEVQATHRWIAVLRQSGATLRVGAATQARILHHLRVAAQPERDETGRTTARQSASSTTRVAARLMRSWRPTDRVHCATHSGNWRRDRSPGKRWERCWRPSIRPAPGNPSSSPHRRPTSSTCMGPDPPALPRNHRRAASGMDLPAPPMAAAPGRCCPSLPCRSPRRRQSMSGRWLRPMAISSWGLP